MDADTLAKILAMDIPADKKVEILAILNARPERSKAAERMARHRAKRHESVTGDVTRYATSDATEVTPPSPPLSPPPLPPTPPFPAPTHTPTPVQVQVSAPASTRETEPDFFPESKPLPPHKRIAWNPETGWTGINATDRKLFASAAPAVDIDRALSASDVWLRANPAKAHKQNFYRFFVNWIAKQQERGGDALRSPNASAPREPLKSFAQQDADRKAAERHGPETLKLKML